MAVVLVGRRREPLATVVQEVRASGGHALALPTDLTDATARQLLVEQVRDELGPLQLLVHNAALLSGGLLSAQPLATVEATVATNLTVPIALTQLCLPDLVAQRGQIVLIGSTTSFVPLPYLALYSATKAGLHSFGTALRHELKPMGVHLLIAYPPTTATPMTAAMWARARQQPGGRFFQPARPEAVGERIVQALIAGKTECHWGGGEALLRLAYRIAPRWVDRSLYGQCRRLAAILGATAPSAAAPMANGDGDDLR